MPELGPIVGIGCHPRGIEHDFMQYEDRSVFRMTSLDVVAEDVTYIVGVLLMLAVFDVMVAMKTKARWFILHLFANALVVITALPDVIQTVRDPANSVTFPDYGLWPVYLVGGIHAYHCIAFSNLTLDDWVHHLLFGGVICTVGLVFVGGPLIAVYAFFLSGLPGGLDYAMLAAVKHGMMDRITEKRWNARVMVWIRSPGCFYCAYTLYVALVYAPIHPTWTQIFGAIAAGSLAMLNGQYYMQVVVGNTHRKDEKYAC